MSPGETERLRAVYAKRDQAKGRRFYSFLHPGQLYLMQSRERELLAALARAGVSHLEDSRILEVGCGNGAVLRDLVKYGADPQKCAGIDLLPDRIAAARRLSPPGLHLVLGDAAALPFPRGYFHLVVAFTVFSSILDAGMKRRLAAEMLRVLAAGGLILWFDYFVSNPSNPDVRGVGKKEIAVLFPGCELNFRRTLLASPLARFLARYSWLGCQFLENLKFLNTHYLGIIRPTR